MAFDIGLDWSCCSLNIVFLCFCVFMVLYMKNTVCGKSIVQPCCTAFVFTFKQKAYFLVAQII